MKASFNPLRVTGRILIAAALTTSMTSPLAASAMEPHPSATDQAAQAVHTQNECAKITGFGQHALSSISSRVAKVNADVTADAAKRLQQEQAFDAKMVTSRAHWDQVREQHFTKLTADAKTNEQKQAVAAFQSTVLAAVATRRLAVDHARDTFRAALVQDAVSRHSQVTLALNAFTTAVNAAVAQANANCATGDPATVRSAFVAALKQARQNLEAAIKAIPKHGPVVEQAAKTRKQTIAQADQAFHQTVQAAVATLKTALGQK